MEYKLIFNINIDDDNLEYSEKMSILSEISIAMLSSGYDVLKTSDLKEYASFTKWEIQ